MADKLGPKETVSFEELLVGNIYNQEALINPLVRKSLIDNDELLNEISELKKKLSK